METNFDYSFHWEKAPMMATFFAFLNMILFYIGTRFDDIHYTVSPIIKGKSSPYCRGCSSFAFHKYFPCD